MATTDELDLVEDEEYEIALLELVTKPKMIQAMREGNLSEGEKLAVKMVDAIIENGPSLSKPLTIFRSFEGASELRQSGGITDNSYLIGSTTGKPSADTVTLDITVPAGTKALQLSDGVFILKRGISLEFKGGDEIIEAYFKNSSSKEGLAVRAIAISPTNAEDLALRQEYEAQLHLAGQHNQADHGKGGGGGAKGAQKAAPGGGSGAFEAKKRKKPANQRGPVNTVLRAYGIQPKRRTAREQTLRNIAGLAVTVGVVVGLVYLGDRAEQRNMRANQPRSKSPEAKGRYVPDADYPKYGLPVPKRDSRGLPKNPF